ncbi:hypothetical protein IWQ56_005552 [Coemansia nantahalensis]|nr:hypothetical protein IWQ56_005552 [Coemansia nantahalensis]
MYPYTDRRYLVPVHHPLHPSPLHPSQLHPSQLHPSQLYPSQLHPSQYQQQPGYGGYQQYSATQPMYSEPGGFVMPVVPGVRDTRIDGGYGQSPLGFVMPAPHPCTHAPLGGSMYSMAPPRPMGDPGGFVVPGTQYPPLHQQEPLSPAFTSTSSVSTAQQYPYASHAVAPQPLSARGGYLSPPSSVAPLSPTAPPMARDAPSRQGSIFSRLTRASRRSGASETVVGSQLRPKHHLLHRQPPRPESGATFRQGDA